MKAFSLPALIGTALMLSACSSPRPAEEADSVSDSPKSEVEEIAEVIEVAESFLTALSAPDTAALSGLLAPGAGIHSVREEAGVTSLRAVSREGFLQGLGTEDQHFLERMWNPTVQVQDGVAMVWTPYDFHRAGEFSHCGIDVFTMLKGPEGWQVTNISYNVVRDGCSPSPLGLPGRSGS